MKISKIANKTEAPSVGRKRDHELDHQILEAAIDILGDVGFDRMTMDTVAAKASAGKASLYRRWPSKAELVRDALVWMSKRSTDVERLPDTGNIHDDLLAVVKAHDKEHSEKKIRILTGLGSFRSEHKKLALEATESIFEPWEAINMQLLQRAIERGEISQNANIEMACKIITAMTSHSVVALYKTFDKAAYSELLNKILLPALKSK